MERDLDHFREEALRARWWAVAIADPVHRERIEAAAREYEQMATIAQRETANRND